ncbi:MAG: VapC toxin family PIN domain ribonuclease [Gammaproteobacteria bacterium]|nr:VapC toxin family PIN domain ribonuclease [Gammaproteobacteria bacterium]
MVAVDANLLVYAHRRDFSFGEAAFAFMVELAERNQPWAIPWPCCYEFLSVTTNRRIWKDKVTPQDHAWRQLHAWAASPSSQLIGEAKDFLPVLSRFVQRPHVVGGIVHDVRIAAICVTHGVQTLFTRDRDFSMFPELPTKDPLEARQGLN